MEIEATPLEGLYLLRPKVFSDDRGFFMESFNEREIAKKGLNFKFVQDNHSKSKFGVLRGLHFQLPPHAQTKLIRVISGKILDVVVDIRVGSETFSKSYSIELSEDNKMQLYIPKGFAHGFVVLSELAEILYKCDEYYYPVYESGIIFNDPHLNIDWGIPKSEIIISDKDKALPFIDEENNLG